MAGYRANRRVSDEAYSLALARSAQRAWTEGPPRGIPMAAAAAVSEFLSGALLDNPQRVGKRLTRELAGYYAARRGAYRVVYRIDDEARIVNVVRIDLRGDVYCVR